VRFLFEYINKTMINKEIKLEQSIHYFCEYCGKECFEKYGAGRFCSQHCAKVFSGIVKRKEISEKLKKFNKNKNKKIRIERYCKICNKKLSNQNKFGYCCKCMYQSTEYKLKISVANKGKCGGYRKNSGRGNAVGIKDIGVNLVMN
jgi:hypothetical protein